VKKIVASQPVRAALVESYLAKSDELTRAKEAAFAKGDEIDSELEERLASELDVLWCTMTEREIDEVERRIVVSSQEKTG
jgi:hypothetical protein